MVYAGAQRDLILNDALQQAERQAEQQRRLANEQSQACCAAIAADAASMVLRAQAAEQQSRKEAARSVRHAAAAAEALNYEVLRLQSHMEAMRVEKDAALAYAEAARAHEAGRSYTVGRAEADPDPMSMHSSRYTGANDGASYVHNFSIGIPVGGRTESVSAASETSSLPPSFMQAAVQMAENAAAAAIARFMAAPKLRAHGATRTQTQTVTSQRASPSRSPPRKGGGPPGRRDGSKPPGGRRPQLGGGGGSGGRGGDDGDDGSSYSAEASGRNSRGKKKAAGDLVGPDDIDGSSSSDSSRSDASAIAMLRRHTQKADDIKRLPLPAANHFRAWKTSRYQSVASVAGRGDGIAPVSAKSKLQPPKHDASLSQGNGF
jgi:hypothetical protein